jgi:hypothetical protein
MGREVKRKSVCCNRDIAKTRTEVLGIGCLFLRVEKTKYEIEGLKASCSLSRFAGSFEERSGRRRHSKRRPSAVVCAVEAQCILYGRPILL